MPIQRARRRPPSEQDERRALLKACCGQRVRALVTFDHPLGIYEGRFSVLGQDTLAIVMEHRIEPPANQGTLVGVQFFKDDYAGLFLTHVFSCTEDYTGNQTLVLFEPGQLLKTEARRSFRVQPDAGAGVTVRCRSAETPWIDAALRDLSRGGLRMAPSENTQPLPEADELTVELTWPEGRQELASRVVRRDGEEVALAFVPGKHLERPDGVASLVSRIERTMLRRRREQSRSVKSSKKP